MFSHPHHNRLDLKHTSAEYTDQKCGSINAKTGRKDYCSPECPQFADDNREIVDANPNLWQRVMATFK